MIIDELGDRMKSYEAAETKARLDQSLPIVARVDGRSFSRFTRDLDRPFDLRLVAAMQETTIALVSEFRALVGYTQSDEISLVFALKGDNPEERLLFDAKVHKLTSLLASFATAAFMRALPRHGLAHKLDALPHFDARVFNVPDEIEATNALVWRVKDASKNAVSMLAQARYSHASLQGVSTQAMLERLERDGHMGDLLDCMRLGTFVRRTRTRRTLTRAEWEAIPERSRPAPDVLVERSKVVVDEVMAKTSFLALENRVGYVFRGEDPVLRDPLAQMSDAPQDAS